MHGVQNLRIVLHGCIIVYRSVYQLTIVAPLVTTKISTTPKRSIFVKEDILIFNSIEKKLNTGIGNVWTFISRHFRLWVTKIGQPGVDPFGWMMKPGAQDIQVILGIGKIAWRKYCVLVLENVKNHFYILDGGMLRKIRIWCKIQGFFTRWLIIRPAVCTPGIFILG